MYLCSLYRPILRGRSAKTPYRPVSNVTKTCDHVPRLLIVIYKVRQPSSHTLIISTIISNVAFLAGSNLASENLVLQGLTVHAVHAHQTSHLIGSNRPAPHWSHPRPTPQRTDVVASWRRADPARPGSRTLHTGSHPVNHADKPHHVLSDEYGKGRTTASTASWPSGPTPTRSSTHPRKSSSFINSLPNHPTLRQDSNWVQRSFYTRPLSWDA